MSNTSEIKEGAHLSINKDELMRSFSDFQMGTPESDG